MLKLAWQKWDPSFRIAPRFPGDVYIRTFRPADQAAAQRLYREGLLTGRLDPNDAAADLSDITAAYFNRPEDHFWVAQANSQVVGTVAMTIDDAGVGHLRRLRVARGWQQSGYTACLLVEKATAHARDHASLKLVLHTPLDDERAVTLLRRLGFEFSRSRDLHGRHLLEFYVNLYTPPGSPGSAAEHGRLI